MNNIFLKIDKIFENVSDDAPKWAEELLYHIKDIKKLLQNENENQKVKITKSHTDIKSFIRGFRKMLKNNEIFVYQARELGINSDGLLYDINTNLKLTSFEAYEVYGYIFKHNIEIKQINSNGRIA